MFGPMKQPISPITKFYEPTDSDSSEPSSFEPFEETTPKSTISDENVKFVPIDIAKQYWSTISTICNIYIRRLGNIRHPNIKTLITTFVSIMLSYYLFSLINLGPPATHRTEYSSPKLQLLREIDEHVDYRVTGFNLQLNSQASLPLESTVQQQLAKNFPYERDEPLPKQIWQTWKVGIDDPDFPEFFKKYSKSWTDNNPDYKHHILTDAECDALVEELYTDVPDVIHTYYTLPKFILRIDFFRYLILFAKGGVYSDMDTRGIKPIDDWVSNYNVIYDQPANLGLVVGVEADPDFDDWEKWYSRKLQFCQWTIQSKKGHPMLRDLIARITDITIAREEMGELEAQYGKDANEDVMDWTGPGIFTDYVFDYLNNILQSSSDFRRRKYETLIDPKFFHNMEQPIVIDDVMVLPITSFCPDIGAMGAKDHNDPMAYVRHMFSGSWKNAEHDPSPAFPE